MAVEIIRTEFPVGEVVDVLIALRNNNEKITFNVTTAAAQLTNPLDFSVSFFNVRCLCRSLAHPRTP